MSKIIGITQGENEAQESLTILWARGHREVSRWIFIHLANVLSNNHDTVEKERHRFAEKNILRAQQFPYPSYTVVQTAA